MSRTSRASGEDNSVVDSGSAAKSKIKSCMPTFEMGEAFSNELVAKIKKMHRFKPTNTTAVSIRVVFDFGKG